MSRRPRTAVALVALALAGLALVGAVSRLRSDPSVNVGANIVVNPEGLIDANNSPSAVRSPRQPGHLAVTHRVDRPAYSAVLNWSIDSGVSWQTTALPLPDGLDRPFAPDLAFGPDGTLYVSYVNLEGPGNAPANLWLSRSSDGGRSLSPPTRVAGRLAFQPRLAVDRAGVVHITWLQASEVGLFRLIGGPNPILASRSADGGRMFSEPVQVNDQERERVGAASPVIDSRGHLVVLYEDFKDDRRDFENLEGPPWDQLFALVVTRSTDGGLSFSPGVELEEKVVPGRRFLVFLPEFPSLAAGPGDELYVAWSDSRSGDLDVFLRRSEDGGRSWGNAVRVNDNPDKDGTDQYLPMVGVAGDGRVDVVFLDRRRDRSNVMTDATLSYSHGGRSDFENLRLSSASFDSRVGASAAPQFGVDFGSRLGLVSTDGRSLAAWTDSRLGSEDTGRQDIMAASYEVEKLPSGIAGLPVISGSLALGVLALSLAWVLGRRADPAPEKP